MPLLLLLLPVADPIADEDKEDGAIVGGPEMRSDPYMKSPQQKSYSRVIILTPSGFPY